LSLLSISPLCSLPPPLSILALCSLFSLPVLPLSPSLGGARSICISSWNSGAARRYQRDKTKSEERASVMSLLIFSLSLSSGSHIDQAPTVQSLPPRPPMLNETSPAKPKARKCSSLSSVLRLPLPSSSLNSLLPLLLSPPPSPPPPPPPSSPSP